MKNKVPIKKYDITQCALYKCRTRKRLEYLLRLDPGGLKMIDGIIGYHKFEIDKKHSDEKREITAPDKTLKAIQRRILYLLQRVIRPEWLISGEKQKCYIDNGKAHLNGKYVLTIDIKKFYDNCTREPVYQFFVQKLKTSPDVAEILTNIITYNGGIPTGCPTSQIMAFYAYSDMFSEIFDLAKQHGCKFTLYVDDMTFSSKEPFSSHQLSQMIDRVLRKYGHKPKYPKVKYYGPSDYKPITGTVVTPEHSLAVPNGLQKTIYDAFQTVKPLIGVETCSEEDARQILSLKGQIQAACNIEDGKFPEIRRLTNQIKVPDSQSVSTRKRQHHRRSKKIHIKQQAPIK
ncbi:reverse transcriptase family protein [Pseudoflavonifractor phocaeensis]|jgi:RNA-directed DNA polymerase|uniref:reverse transcriptase family protein n=1 Tax=Pseudoflavonifractor phocaeensis TaxID=1870988 RepID=UPI00195A6E93|nr:reverse transcriptase family protein [Pseudoflavonifractor phocaeensis]MBM6885683.1 RNA-directed DNA polymerase [Pseudoflavonifractor phocaeensis]